MRESGAARLKFSDDRTIINLPRQFRGGVRLCRIGGVRSHTFLSREHAPAGVAFVREKKKICFSSSIFSKKCYNKKVSRGYSSVGRAMRSQRIGQGFESPYLHFPETAFFSMLHAGFLAFCIKSEFNFLVTCPFFA